MAVSAKKKPKAKAKKALRASSKTKAKKVVKPVSKAKNVKAKSARSKTSVSKTKSKSRAKAVKVGSLKTLKGWQLAFALFRKGKEKATFFFGAAGTDPRPFGRTPGGGAFLWDLFPFWDGTPTWM